ncbi:MAG: PilZ domain-containing protein [Candidatus Omnitrophica bacterium]|nr:PilZ domain-containing protein [Candidatus Omnitrophota bacterium]
MSVSSRYKRKYDRLYAPFSIRILTYNHERLDPVCSTAAVGANISPNGISFTYPNILDRHDHIKVLINNINGFKKELMVNAKIVWFENRDVISRRYGARIVKINPEDKYLLIKHIRNYGGRDEMFPGDKKN